MKLSTCALLTGFLFVGCGEDTKNCTIADNGDGTARISCPDGTSTVVGNDNSCTVADNGDGTSTITCDDGSETTVGNDDSCSIADNGDGTSTIICDDGTEVTVGEDNSCTIADNGDGTSTITCDDGTAVTVGDDESCTIEHSGNGTSTITCDDGTAVTVEDAAIYFYSTATFASGDLGDRAATTATCGDALPEGTTCPNGNVAFLAYGGGDDLVSMPESYGVPTNRPIESLSGVRIADDWADLFDGDGLTHSLLDAGVMPESAVFYSGANVDGTVSTHNCGDWTVSTVAASFDAGGPSITSLVWNHVSGGPYGCALDARFVCLCY